MSSVLHALRTAVPKVYKWDELKDGFSIQNNPVREQKENRFLIAVRLDNGKTGLKWIHRMQMEQIISLMEAGDKSFIAETTGRGTKTKVTIIPKET